MKDLAIVHRPTTLMNVVGQEDAISILRPKLKSGDIPHAVMFHGPSGVGKTTLARIVAKAMHCSDHDLMEMNNADYRGIDAIRLLRRSLGMAPKVGDVRVFILDECHKLTGEAQHSILKMLEEPPSHVYFMLCTTEPEKLLKTIRTRTMKVRLQAIKQKDLLALLRSVSTKSSIKINKAVADKIVEYADGSAREALQILETIQDQPDIKSMLKCIERASTKAQTIEIVRMLLKRNVKWPTVAPLLQELKGEDAEGVRRMILGYPQSVLLKRDDPRAYRILELFLDNFYDCGFSGVVAACYQIVSS